MKLTEKFLQGAKTDRRRDLGTDRTGLILRLTPDRGSTTRTFRYRYFRDGSAKYVKLGDYPALSLRDAHDLHGRCQAAASRGEDPQDLVEAWWSERAPQAVVAGPNGPTVKDVVSEFLKVAERDRKRPEQARYLLEHNVLPKLGHLPAETLKRRDIVVALDAIVDRGSRVLANRVQAVLKQAFAVAADRGLIESVPVFPRKPAGGDEASRTRVLTDDEIRRIWTGLDALSAPPNPSVADAKADEESADTVTKILRPLALALKLALVTAQRRGEIAAARWDEISVEIEQTKTGPVERHTWTIPTSPKRGKARENLARSVPLSPLAQSLLAELKTLAGKSDYWLPSKRSKGAPTDRARSISKAARDARKALKMADWRPHDLRRTARTNLSKLGIAEEVAERVLGHGHADPMVETYNRHTYLVEMRGALDAWADELQRILSAKDGAQ